jgi:deazaflavin-dependent oxidoreductase (nitroreductase family)
MKIFMQMWMAIHVFMYRLTGGKIGGKMGGDVLLLDTVGRKSGNQRTNPVMFFRDGGAYVITASAGGAPANPGWYYNLRAHPQTSIQVMDQRIQVIASEADQGEHERLWAKLVSISPQFKRYQTRTTRKIPMLLLKPN